MTKQKGWERESARHALSAKGVKTNVSGPNSNLTNHKGVTKPSHLHKLKRIEDRIWKLTREIKELEPETKKLQKHEDALRAKDADEEIDALGDSIEVQRIEKKLARIDSEMEELIWGLEGTEVWNGYLDACAWVDALPRNLIIDKLASRRSEYQSLAKSVKGYLETMGRVSMYPVLSQLAIYGE